MAKMSSHALMVNGIVGAALIVAIITAVGGRVIGSSQSLKADVAWVTQLV